MVDSKGSEKHSAKDGVLPTKYSAGPHGLGDPEDRTLRKVEDEILVPRKMRDKAKNEKCVAEVAEFNRCCKAAGLSMVYKCRKENDDLKNCLTRWYQDEDFKKICQEEYLNERSEFRRTGIRTKDAIRKESTTF
ncbi:hypothetical protein CHUAL_000809 [Chamberlinius hualienensis]